MHTNNDDKKSITCPSQKIVFFDLDGTILSGISSENSFILYLFKHNYIGLSQLLKCMLFTFRWLSKFKMQIFVKNKAYLAGMPIEQMKELGENFVKKELLCDLRPKLQHRIEEHRKAGDMLVLLTGSLEFLARIFAEHLGINHVEATHLVKNKHLFSHHPPIQHPYGKEKLTIAKRVCKKHGIDIETCIAYGNSIHDEAILGAVGLAVAVTPDKKLLEIAKKKGWEVIDSL